jgi:hypothetical protein
MAVAVDTAKHVDEAVSRKREGKSPNLVALDDMVPAQKQDDRQPRGKRGDPLHRKPHRANPCVRIDYGQSPATAC